MMEQKASALNCWFEEKIAMCEQRNQALLTDDRADEATFEKIRANVYDIFRTILSVAVKTCKGEEEAVRRFFVQRAQVIPSSWAASYEKAKQHDDSVKMQIEQIKLDAIDEIKERFTSIWEEAE